MAVREAAVERDEMSLRALSLEANLPENVRPLLPSPVAARQRGAVERDPACIN